eukprot:gene4346-4925_t
MAAVQNLPENGVPEDIKKMNLNENIDPLLLQPQDDTVYDEDESTKKKKKRMHPWNKVLMLENLTKLFAKVRFFDTFFERKSSRGSMKRVKFQFQNLQENYCCVCKQICESHHCFSCGKNCHPFCGTAVGEEGYGGRVLCTTCKQNDEVNRDIELEEEEEDNLNVAVAVTDDTKVKMTKPESKQRTIMALFGQNEPTPAKKLKKCIAEKRMFCLLCARAVEESGKTVVQGKEKYIICRPDRTSKNRHVQRNHKDVKVKDDAHYSFLVDPSHKEAVAISKKIDAISQSDNIKQPSNHKAQHLPTLVQATVKPVLPTSLETDEQKSNDPKPENQLLLNMDKKLDDLARAVDKISLQASTTCKEKEQKNIEIGPLLAVGQKNFEEALPIVDEWNNVSNIYDITQLFPQLRLFPGSQDGQISVLRCDVCYRFLTKDPFSSLDNQKEAFASANAGIGRYSGSIACGIILSSENYLKLMDGHNSYWYNMKRQIKNHLLCSGELSQLHMNALKYKDMTDKRRKRGVEVTENLVRICLNIIEMKVAAHHFENSIACHIATGSDMGDMSHGRKQFNEIMKAAEIHIDKETKKFLLQPLESTCLPPHFYVTADKATVNRVTNQAVMFGLMIEGKRCAIPVKANEVYSILEEEITDNDLDEQDYSDEDDPKAVSGATAQQLATSIYNVLKETYQLELNRLLDSAIPKKMQSLSENHEDIKNMQYKGTPLVQGWLVTGQQRAAENDPPNDVWTAREIHDCEQDLRCLASDLLTSFKIRIQEVNQLQKVMLCMDLDSIVKLVVGERNKNGFVKINEGALESYGAEEFRLYYQHICSQRHIRELAELKDLMLDPSLSHVVHRALKNFLKDLFWNPNNLCLLMKCILVLSEKDQLVPITRIFEKEVVEDLTALKKKVGQLQVFGMVDDNVTERFVLQNIYILEFSKLTLYAVLNEEELLQQIYANPEIYNALVVPVSLTGSRRVKNQNDLNLDDDASDVDETQDLSTDNSILDAYADRLHTGSENMENMNLFQFSNQYTIYRNRLTKISANVVPRFFPVYSANPQGKNYHLYCKFQLILYKPWQNCTTEIINSEESVENYIHAWNEFLRTPFAESNVPDWYNRLQDVIQHENAEQNCNVQQTENCEQEEWMIISDLHSAFQETINENNLTTWHETREHYSTEQLVRLFYSNEDVANYNRNSLLALNTPIAHIEANHSPISAKTVSSVEFAFPLIRDDRSAFWE